MMKIMYGRRLKVVAISTVKISEKGLAHKISINKKHCQDLPAPRKTSRGQRGRKRRQYSQQLQLPVTSSVLN